MKPFVLFAAIFICFVSSCETTSSTIQKPSDTVSDTTKNSPAYLKDFWRGYQIFDSAAGRFVDAPVADQTVLKNYKYYTQKGDWLGETRITIASRKLKYAINEPVRVGHIVEESGTDRKCYIMGPKPIADEYMNDSLATQQGDAGDAEYPWLSLVYDGKVLPTPGVDYNFEFTEYRFEKAGTYTIQWRPGKFKSNTLTIVVE